MLYIISLIVGIFVWLYNGVLVMDLFFVFKIYFGSLLEYKWF